MSALHRLTSLALATGLLASPILADGRDPGSRLVFPVHHSGNHFTVLAVTNTNLVPANQVQLGGTTLVHFEYVNTRHADPDHPLVATECSIHDDTETLTPADTFVVLTECHNAEDPDGQSGYVVVTAADPSTGTDWAFDYLSGSELVVNASGGAYSLNAVPFTSGGVILPGDAIGYEPFPDKLILDSFVALAGSHLSLTAFMEDPNDIASIHIQAWNDNEQHMSATFEMGCWFDAPLATVADMFTEDHLAGSGNDPSELDLNCNGVGTIETGWALIDCVKVETPGGSTVDPDGVPLLGAVTAGVTSLIDGGRDLWEVGQENVVEAFLVVEGTGRVGDEVEFVPQNNGEWFDSGDPTLWRLGGIGDVLGGDCKLPVSGLTWFRSTDDPGPFPGATDVVTWALDSSAAEIGAGFGPTPWAGAQHGDDNWVKVISDTDGAVSWAQMEFDFNHYPQGTHVAGDPQPILIDIPRYVTRSDGVDFSLPEAIAQLP